eukprot:3560561-Rhodomonas_salina.2
MLLPGPALQPPQRGIFGTNHCLCAYAPDSHCPVLTKYMVLSACYALSGTDQAYGSIGLHACYAMSGTDLVYGAMILCHIRY